MTIAVSGDDFQIVASRPKHRAGRLTRLLVRQLGPVNEHAQIRKTRRDERPGLQAADQVVNLRRRFRPRHGALGLRQLRPRT